MLLLGEVAAEAVVVSTAVLVLCSGNVCTREGKNGCDEDDGEVLLFTGLPSLE